jgi:hypothetical protein
MIFKACSGALTNDIFAGNAVNFTEPSQQSWLDQNTKDVTLTIGGNDAGFAWVIEHCIFLPPLLPRNCAKNKALGAETDARMAALGGGAYATSPSPLSSPIHSILSVLETIHAHAPSTHVYVGLYPLLFGKAKSKYPKPLLSPLSPACEVGPNLWVSYKDAMWLDKQGTQLDTIISQAVTTARKNGANVTLAKATTNFAGHGFCDERERWFYRLEPEAAIQTEGELGLALSVEPGSFHPTAVGQQFGYEAAFSAAIK